MAKVQGDGFEAVETSSRFSGGQLTAHYLHMPSRLQSWLQFHLKISPPIFARHDVYSGHHVIAEYRTVGQSTTLVKYVYGPGIDQPVMMVLDDGEEETKYYFHQDRLGSIIALSDESGDIVEGYTYDAFGPVLVNLTAGTDGNWLTPDGATASYSQVGNPYYFTGRRLDPETGLYYYRARYYHPTLGRFLQPDPIGYAGGLNLYGYCGNDPVNCVDPMGLISQDRDGNQYMGDEGQGVDLSGSGPLDGLEPLMNPLAPLMRYQGPLMMDSDGRDGIVPPLSSPKPSPDDFMPPEETKSEAGGDDFWFIPPVDRERFLRWWEDEGKGSEGLGPGDHLPWKELQKRYEAWKQMGKPRGQGDKPNFRRDSNVKKVAVVTGTGVLVYVVVKKIVGGILIVVPEPVTSAAGVGLVVTP